MKITSIKQQVKNPERLSIFVGGKYEFSLSLDELVKYELKNDDELSKTDVKRFKKISADGKLRARALEWLMNRPHSGREFRDYLYRKKVEPEQIDALAAEFAAKGYLDDAKFAVWFVELQIRRNKSDRQIRAELFRKGIGRDLADQVLKVEEDREDNRLRNLIEKKSKLSRYQQNPQRLAQYLAGKGFGWEKIKTALGETGSSKDT